MAIKHLNHQERDLTLADRESGPAPEPEDALAVLRSRIERAKQQATRERAMKQHVPTSHCGCFDRGWMAALAMLDQP